MISVRFVDQRGRIYETRGEEGQSAMELGLAAGVEGLEAQCGGSCSCATCHVFVAPEWMSRLGAASEDEIDLLEHGASEVRQNSRLSCQIKLTRDLDGLDVEVAPTI